MTYLLKLFGGILLMSLFLVGTYYFDPVYVVLVFKVAGFFILTILLIIFMILLYAYNYKLEPSFWVYLYLRKMQF